MEYVRIAHDGDGGSISIDVTVDLQQQPFAEGVPPLLVSPVTACTSAVFLEFPADVVETEPHPAPRRQFGAVLSGRAETETTDGQTRQFGPGAVVLLEDTEGRGHVTRILEGPFRILFVATDDAAQ